MSMEATERAIGQAAEIELAWVKFLVAATYEEQHDKE